MEAGFRTRGPQRLSPKRRLLRRKHRERFRRQKVRFFLSGLKFDAYTGFGLSIKTAVSPSPGADGGSHVIFKKHCILRAGFRLWSQRRQATLRRYRRRIGLLRQIEKVLRKLFFSVFQDNRPGMYLKRRFFGGKHTSAGVGQPAFTGHASGCVCGGEPGARPVAIERIAGCG